MPPGDWMQCKSWIPPLYVVGWDRQKISEDFILGTEVTIIHLTWHSLINASRLQMTSSSDCSIHSQDLLTSSLYSLFNMCPNIPRKIHDSWFHSWQSVLWQYNKQDDSLQTSNFSSLLSVVLWLGALWRGCQWIIAPLKWAHHKENKLAILCFPCVVTGNLLGKEKIGGGRAEGSSEAFVC